jgi:hypothetical protein
MRTSTELRSSFQRTPYNNGSTMQIHGAQPSVQTQLQIDQQQLAQLNIKDVKSEINKDGKL